MKKFLAVTFYVILLAPILAITIGEMISRQLGATPFWDMMIQITVFLALCVPLRLAITKPAAKETP